MSRLPAIANPQRQPYPSDLSDLEWEIIKPLVPLPKGFGHPIEVDFREIFNGIFYVHSYWMSVGNDASRSASLQHGIQILQKMAKRRFLATDAWVLYAKN